MIQRLTGHFFIFGLVFFVLKPLLGITRQWRNEKFAILSLKPQSHDRSLYIKCGLLTTEVLSSLPLLILANQTDLYAKLKQSHVVSKVQIF